MLKYEAYNEFKDTAKRIIIKTYAFKLKMAIISKNILLH